jgi:uncharacterized Zn finger protein
VWERKVLMKCPFCNEESVNMMKTILTDEYFECYIRCSSCGFDMVGRKELKKVKISLDNGERKKYDKLFNKFRVRRSDNT